MVCQYRCTSLQTNVVVDPASHAPVDRSAVLQVLDDARVLLVGEVDQELDPLHVLVVRGLHRAPAAPGRVLVVVFRELVGREEGVVVLLARGPLEPVPVHVARVVLGGGHGANVNQGVALLELEVLEILGEGGRGRSLFHPGG